MVPVCKAVCKIAHPFSIHSVCRIVVCRIMDPTRSISVPSQSEDRREERFNTPSTRARKGTAHFGNRCTKGSETGKAEVQDRARYAARSAEERAARVQHMSSYQQQRLASETPEERAARLHLYRCSDSLCIGVQDCYIYSCIEQKTVSQLCVLRTHVGFAHARPIMLSIPLYIHR